MGMMDKAKRAGATAAILGVLGTSGSPKPPSTQLGRWQNHVNRQRQSQSIQTKRQAPRTSGKK